MRIPVAYRCEFFELRPSELTYANVRAHVDRFALTVRSLMYLYAKNSVDRAVELLEQWEADPTAALALLGPDRVRMIVWDLREFLNTAGRLRDMPEDWVDPFNHAQFMEAKRRRVQAHLQAQLQVAASTTASSAEQEAKLRQGLTALPSANDSAVVASFAPVFANLGPPLIVPEGETQKARSRSARRRRVREYQRLERLGLRKPFSGEPLPLVITPTGCLLYTSDAADE